LLRGIRFQQQVPLPVQYRGLQLECRAQVLTYLKLTNLRLGLLINFNVEVLRRGLYRIING
jgi:hypothetical protein